MSWPPLIAAAKISPKETGRKSRPCNAVGQGPVYLGKAGWPESGGEEGEGGPGKSHGEIVTRSLKSHITQITLFIRVC